MIDYPGAPIITSAVGMNGSVVLDWQPPVSDGGSAVVSYRIYRGTAPGAETFLTSVGAISKTFNDGISIVNGTTYFYRVSAVNGLGEGPKSNEAFATPSASIGKPGASVLQSVVSSSGSGPIVVSWLPPVVTGDLPILNYRVYRRTSPGSSSQPIYVTVDGSITSITDTNIVPGATYFYTVVPVNTLGAGPFSNELSARVGTGPAPQNGPPTPPTITKAVGMNSGGNPSVELAWLAPAWDGLNDLTTYRVYRGTRSGGEVFETAFQATTTSVVDGISIVAGTTYFYRISASNQFGESGPSNEVSATVPGGQPTVPAAPVLNSAN